MKEYLEEFHKDLIGLTGTYDQIKQICKAYRVYFSTPPEIKPGQDYLVDHSIYFYLMGEVFPERILACQLTWTRPRRRLCRSTGPTAHSRAGGKYHRFPHQRLDRAFEEGLDLCFHRHVHIFKYEKDGLYE